MRYLPILIGLALLSACTPNQLAHPFDKAQDKLRLGEGGSPSSDTGQVTREETQSSQPIVQPTEERETHNVSYRGIVQPAGISIYTQGSHRLMLSDGRFILLESEEIDLNGYVGEEVELSGSTRATIEAKGIIMRVEKAKLILSASSQSTVSSAPVESSEPEPLPSPSTSLGTSSIPLETKDDTQASKPPEPIVLTTVVEAMANENFSAENWTQEYCSSHIGFCFPVHRNWWYKSFGTTISTLWHVEIGNSPVLNLGDGPISVNILSGNLPLEANQTSTIRTENDRVIASRPWSNNRYIEIRSHMQLDVPVRYMIDHISSYEGN